MRSWFFISLFVIVCFTLVSAFGYTPAADAVTATSTPPAPMAPNLPEDVNPLNGRIAADPSLLKLPAVLVSVSNFPGATRPQVGISFASQIYEFWIGVGMTRFLPIFYGEFPAIRPAMVGNCPVRWGVYGGSEPFIGKRVWYDENHDGLMNVGERGVPGVCIDLDDAASGETIASTTSDSNGYYGFPFPSVKDVRVRFHPPMGSAFTSYGVESQADPETGLSESFSLSQNNIERNAGFVWKDEKPVIPVVGKGDVEVSQVVWFDSNRDNVIDEGEGHLAGVQVNLYDGANNALLAVTRTDAEGRYTFKVEADRNYYLRLLPDLGASFVISKEHMENDPSVNDYEDPVSGISPIFTSESFVQNPWTLGLKVIQTGPVRSGRIIFQYIASFFNRARLFYASKSENVLIGGSGNVYSEDPRNISSAYIEVARMIEAAQTAEGDEELHYTSNIFSDTPPAGGSPAHIITYFVNVTNVSQFRYDPLSGEYLRWDDHEDGRGDLYPSQDRLTGRQLHASNVVVVFAEHSQVEGLKIDMSITPNQQNPAAIFRDGKVYSGIWSTLNEEYEKTTQKLRPPRIYDENRQLFPLKPGQTWFIMVTPQTTLTDEGGGAWRVRFFEPELEGNFLKFTR